MTPHHTGKAPAKRSVITRRSTLAAIAVLMGGTVALTACNSGGSGHASGADGKATSVAPSATASASASAPAPKGTQAKEDAAAEKATSDAHITISPHTGSTGASIHSAKVTVTGGTLTSVTMRAKATGAAVAGTISADGKSWTPDSALARGTQYAVAAAATDAQGRPAATNSTFATTSAYDTFIGYFTPEDGSTVGVGMPVSINFDKPITSAHRAAVERAITVTSSSGQVVAGHWFSATRLDFRPQQYWQAGSHVSLALHLDGVKGAPGVYGVQHKTVNFTVGRSQVSTVDTKTHMMTVVRDGQVIKTIPISAGAPDHTTYDGQMVIAEKFQTTRMNGATVGFTQDDGKGEYDIKDVPHAMRLSNSGTFIHGNYWGSKAIFGHTNTSHGCIGISDTKGGKDATTPAAWFFANSLVGDVVIVKNSPDKTIQPDNGLNGWNMSWAAWTAPQ